jgi:hypothetical protein
MTLEFIAALHTHTGIINIRIYYFPIYNLSKKGIYINNPPAIVEKVAKRIINYEV